MLRKYFHQLGVAVALITLAGCGVRASEPDAEEKNVKAQVKPTFTTDMVEFDTDDPAIWINPDDRSKRLIIGTDKSEHGGLYVFDPDGKEIKDKTIKGLKRPNNVDIEYGLLLNMKPLDKVGTNNVQLPYLGTKTPYSFPHVNYTPPPAGYKPVFISHVGRHGARFLTKAGADQQVLQVLQAAEKRHALTEMGQRIMVIAGRLQAAGKGNYESITLLGREEQGALGSRMHELYSCVFTGRGLKVATTWKLRTQQSAEAFLKGFGKYTGRVDHQQAPDSMDTVLRFYDLSPGYQQYKKGVTVKTPVDSLDRDERTLVMAKSVCGRLFSDGFAKELMDAGKGVAFADNLYDLYAIAWSMSGELSAAGHPDDKEGLGVAFSREDLEWLEFRDGAADFLEKGPGFDSAGIQVTVAAPLLKDFIASLDRATASPAAGDGILRFTHAEAIAPFAALLGIRGASTPVQSIYRYHESWQAGNVIPLSANIQWVLYAGSDGSYLVKVLLNEKEAVLPVATSQWPYYRWEDLRTYYEDKLQRLSIRG